MTLSILGIDIAKHTYQLHGADPAGKMVFKKRVDLLLNLTRVLH